MSQGLKNLCRPKIDAVTCTHEPGLCAGSSAASQDEVYFRVRCYHVSAKKGPEIRENIHIHVLTEAR